MPWCAHQSLGRAGGEPFGQGQGVARQPIRYGQAIDDPERQRAAGVEPLADRVSSAASFSPTIAGSNAVMPPSGLAPRWI